MAIQPIDRMKAKQALRTLRKAPSKRPGVLVSSVRPGLEKVAPAFIGQEPPRRWDCWWLAPQ